MFLVSEHLRTAKIPCKERVRKYRIHEIGVFSEKRGCPNIYGVRKKQVYHFFFLGGGGLFFPRSRFIKAIISINMYIVRSSSPEGAGVSFFFFFFWGGGGGG